MTLYFVQLYKITWRGTTKDAPHMIRSSFCCWHGWWQFSSCNDCRPTFLHSWQKNSLKPVIIVDHFRSRFSIDSSMSGIRKLSWCRLILKLILTHFYKICFDMRGLANHLTNVSFIKNTADLKCQKSQSYFSATMKSAEFLMNGKIVLIIHQILHINVWRHPNF